MHAHIYTCVYTLDKDHSSRPYTCVTHSHTHTQNVVRQTIEPTHTHIHIPGLPTHYHTSTDTHVKTRSDTHVYNITTHTHTHKHTYTHPYPRVTKTTSRIYLKFKKSRENRLLSQTPAIFCGERHATCSTPTECH